MKKPIALTFLMFITSCAPLYYGYLPGTNYKYYKPHSDLDLDSRRFNIVFLDERKDLDSIKCSQIPLDRTTELEGKTGFMYFCGYVLKMIENSNGIIDPESSNTIVMRLEGLSFSLIGFGQIVPHGLVQFDVLSKHLEKCYCVDMTDRDEDAPLKWYSVVTRKTASREIVSGSLRRAIETFVKDLGETPLNWNLETAKR